MQKTDSSFLLLSNSCLILFVWMEEEGREPANCGWLRQASMEEAGPGGRLENLSCVTLQNCWTINFSSGKGWLGRVGVRLRRGFVGVENPCIWTMTGINQSIPQPGSQAGRCWYRAPRGPPAGANHSREQDKWAIFFLSEDVCSPLRLTGGKSQAGGRKRTTRLQQQASLSAS